LAPRRHGVIPPGGDRAWECYRQSLPYGYYLWAITRALDEAITVEFVKRLGIAVADHRSLELLRA